ncbi:MAG: peptidase T [Succinivibrio sp.]|nr:peptidase T [Succinivibrio sp.]
MDLKQELVSRFMRYAAIPSQSDEEITAVPSSQGQRELSSLLARELSELGLADVYVDEHAICYGTLKGNCKGPALGWCAHLDTVDVSLSSSIHPQLIRYTGGDVCLNEEKQIYLKTAEHPELERYRGEEILFSDGTSVLGADNKSAIANIMTMLAVLADNPELKHPEIRVAFVPDEEKGLCGSKLLDLNRFKVDFAYTIDSCELGEVVWETFNAGSGTLKVQGVSAHPMSAKGVLVNPLLVVHDYIAMFDRSQTPECTADKDGYWWFQGGFSDPLNATLSINIRDHDKERYEWRKQVLRDNLELLQRRHPKARLELTLVDVYENIANHVTRDDKPVAMLYQALSELNIKARTYAMRGGTDGSALSAKGLVTPNYFTGAHNFHSYAEFLPLSSFEKSLQVTLKLVELASRD